LRTREWIPPPTKTSQNAIARRSGASTSFRTKDKTVLNVEHLRGRGVSTSRFSSHGRSNFEASRTINNVSALFPSTAQPSTAQHSRPLPVLIPLRHVNHFASLSPSPALGLLCPERPSNATSPSPTLSASTAASSTGSPKITVSSNLKVRPRSVRSSCVELTPHVIRSSASF
jgi:hypothetical protein